MTLVHPGSSGGNFSRFPPGGGLSLCPVPPCWLRQAYFPPSSLLVFDCCPYYLQKPGSVKTRFGHRSGTSNLSAYTYLIVESTSSEVVLFVVWNAHRVDKLQCVLHLEPGPEQVHR